MIPEKYYDLFEKKTYAYLATLLPNGLIQNHPMLVARDGDNIKFSSIKERQKYRNLEKNPIATMLVMDPESPFRWVEVRGRVEMEEDVDNVFIDTLAQRYFGTERYEKDPPGVTRMIFTLKPERVKSQG